VISPYCFFYKFQDLPQPVSHTPKANPQTDDTDELSIAWRYKNVKTNEVSFYQLTINRVQLTFNSQDF